MTMRTLYHATFLERRILTWNTGLQDATFASIGSYKSAVTNHARRLGFDFGWQTRFRGRIVRDNAAYQRINDYIESNPANWAMDKCYP